MKKKIYDFIENTKNIELVSRDIIEALHDDNYKNNFEYSFDIQKGTGKVKTLDPNTSFSFDPKKGSPIDVLKETMFDSDLQGILNEEEEEIVKNTDSFLEKVSNYIIENHIEEIRNIIRKIVLGGADPEAVPLENISITSISITDFSSIPEPAKYLVKIGKYPNSKNVNTTKVVQYLHERQEKTQQSVEEIFEEEKGKNTIFDEVAAVLSGKKYLYEVHISMFVDYSLSKEAFPVEKA